MKYIEKDMKIKEIIERYQEVVPFFESNGFKGIADEEVLKILGNLKIEIALKSKKISVEDFLKAVNEVVEINRESVDVNLSQGQGEKADLSLVGLLPCPVKNPLLEGLKGFEKDKGISLNLNLKAASSGLDWLKEDVLKSNDPSRLADIFISAGFDLFFEEELMGKYKREKVFKDIVAPERYNKDFDNEKISLKDPDGDYSMLAVVPAVFLVNKEELGDRPMPRSWSDLLTEDFEGSVSLPISDFDLFNAILLNIYKSYGEDGVRKLRKTLLSNMHPSQMVKSNKLKSNIPTVTIMPYFFTKMTGGKGPMTAVWPEDGAIISPIFMLTKDTKDEKIVETAKFLASKEVGKVLSHQGLFPSVNEDVENNLDGKKFQWVGWEYIKENNIGKILKRCEEVFFESDN